MTDKVQVELLREAARLPKQQSDTATGFDLYACLDKPATNGYVVLKSDHIRWVPTGIAIAVPPDLEASIRPRSGLFREGVFAMIGTIDPDYRGELMVGMTVLFGREHVVEHGDRIAQMVFTPRLIPELVEVDHLSSTKRGTAGFGSTGR